MLLVGCRLLPTVAVVLLACMRELLRDIVMARLLRRGLRRRPPGKKRATSAPRMHSARRRFVLFRTCSRRNNFYLYRSINVSVTGHLSRYREISTCWPSKSSVRGRESAAFVAGLGLPDLSVHLASTRFRLSQKFNSFLFGTRGGRGRTHGSHPAHVSGSPRLPRVL